MKIVVLGAGMVGRTIAMDLSKSYSVTSVDINENNLSRLQETKVKTLKADLADTSRYRELLSGADLVISAVPGFMGYRTLEAIITEGKNVVDISFFPEDALNLDQLAKEKHVTAIVDCGVAPGMGNLILGFYNSIMKIKSFECMVGGLPLERKFPFEYKAPFSPVDVIEEYTREARYVENGFIVKKPALSDPEYIYVENIGTLEAFNTDGLRSILTTMKHIPDMKEKTLRYPGHINLIKALQAAGFFSTNQRIINGQNIRPLDFTSSILFDQWKLNDYEKEFTYMRIKIAGEKEGKQTEVLYEVHDQYDEITSTSSMSRTTGYTCTAAANLILKGLFSKSGVFPPELIGPQKNCFDFVLGYLEERNVRYKCSINLIKA